MKTSYQNFTSRNLGYIDSELQKKISLTRILIAGCGIGSQVAEAAARVGFQHFVLVDGDTVDIHNLNRQSFFLDQVGKHKVHALRENILRINPEAQIEAIPDIISEKNARYLVGRSDLIFDTIDFLDLKGIVALHDESHRMKKILVSSFSVGFGAAVISFPRSEKSHAWLRDIFSLPATGSLDGISYVERYIALFSSLATAIDPQVLQVMQKVFQDLAEGKTCPAPQVCPGAYTVASACITAALRLLNDQQVTAAPEMVVINLSEALQKTGLKLVNSK